MAIEEMFTSLPTVGSAQMTDIICAVQGYSSPASLGLSVQESLQQVYNLFQSNVILYYAGNPNGNVAGSTYQFCWDTTNHILYVCTTTGTSGTAVWTKSITLTAGTGITIVQSGSTISISTSSSGYSWNNVTGTSASMIPEHGYVANNSGLVTLALPTTSSFGDSIRIMGYGSGGWTISQASGQQIIIGNTSSTLGAGGSVSSTAQNDSLELICLVANTIWQTPSGVQGTLTIV